MEDDEFLTILTKVFIISVSNFKNHQDFIIDKQAIESAYLSDTQIIKDIFVYFLRHHTILCLVIKSKWSKDLESPTSINSQQSITRVWFF